jgi:hypothetical protein
VSDRPRIPSLSASPWPDVADAGDFKWSEITRAAPPPPETRDQMNQVLGIGRGYERRARADSDATEWLRQQMEA